MKKLRTLTALIAVLCSCAISAYDFEVNGIYYNKLSSTTVEVTSGTDKYSGDVAIPESVTCMGSTYSVVSIANNAFYDCRELEKITISNGVMHIGDYAFRDCSKLMEIVIPKSVVSVGYNAFYCSGLASIVVSESTASIGYEAFHGTPWWERQEEGVIYINNILYAYKGRMEEGTAVVVKEGTRSIADYAFERCRNLEKITIPNSVTSIGDEAFFYCSGLKEIIIPNSIMSIGTNAFEGTSWWESQKGVIYIGQVLYGCKGDSYSLTSVDIKDGTKSIADYAFEGCSGLKEISIPNSVTSIGSGAFSYCSGLKEITIPNSVTSIGGYTFEGCI